MGVGNCAGGCSTAQPAAEPGPAMQYEDRSGGPGGVFAPQELASEEAVAVAPFGRLTRVDEADPGALEVPDDEGPSQQPRPRRSGGAAITGVPILGREGSAPKMAPLFSNRSQATSRESYNTASVRGSVATSRPSSSNSQARMARSEEFGTTRSGASIMQGIQRRIRQLDVVNQNFASSEAPLHFVGSPRHLTSRSDLHLEQNSHLQRKRRASVSIVHLVVGFCIFVSVAFSAVTMCLLEAAVAKSEQDSQSPEKILASVRLTGIIACGSTTLVVVALGATIALCSRRSMQRIEMQLRMLGKAEDEEEWASTIVPVTGSRVADFQRLQRAIGRLRSSIATFHSFLPQTIVQNIVRGDDRAQRLHVERRDVSIMFSDIKDFTTISEALRPRETLLLLTRYLDVMCRIAHSFDGLVAEVLGDGLLVFWNTPDEVEDHRPKAVAAALAMQRSLRPLNADLEAVRLPSLSVRVGLHTGKVLTGNIGSLDRMKFGCIGDPVNLCSRLEGLCKMYRVATICSGQMYEEIRKHGFICRKLDVVRVKGKSKPTEIYEVVGLECGVEVGLLGSGKNSSMSSRVSTSGIADLASKAVDESSRRVRMSMENQVKSSATLDFVKSRLRLSRDFKNETTDVPTLTTEASGVMRSRRTTFSEVSMRHSVGGAITDEVRNNIRGYERALEAYQAGAFLKARDLLQELLGMGRPNDDVHLKVIVTNEHADLGGDTGQPASAEGDGGLPPATPRSPASPASQKCPASPTSQASAEPALAPDGPTEALLERVLRYIGDDGGASVRLTTREIEAWDGIRDLTEK